MRKTIVRFLKILGVVYAVVGTGIYFLQDKILLRPVKLAADHQFNFDVPFKEVNIPYDSKSNINMVRFLPADSAVKGVVLYFHGNRTNISRYKKFVPYFTRSGYEVWMMDYPGYGKSTGKFTESVVYEWSLLMYKLARTRFSKNCIIVYGKSLGTGVAAQLASVRNCRYLVLETPYYSLPAVVGHYAPVYPVNQMIRLKFPTYEYLPRVSDPVVLIHGTSDRTVPYGHAAKLSALLKPADKLITLEEGTHNNLYSFPAVPRVIDSLLSHAPVDCSDRGVDSLKALH